MMKPTLATASLLLCAALAHASDTVAPVDALWKPQVINFVYRPNDAVYTCSGLWQKLAGMLVHVGARPAAPSDRFKCDDVAGILTLEFALESPAEATPENLRALTEHDSEALLVARLQGREAAAANEVRHFPAAWQTRSFRDRRLQLTVGDCELVQQLRQQILPKLAVEVVSEPPRCSALLVHGGRPAMTVRALVVTG